MEIFRFKKIYVNYSVIFGKYVQCTSYFRY